MVTEDQIRQALREVYDPEISVNVQDLGLIYAVNILDEGVVEIVHTLTSAVCPFADEICEDIEHAAASVEGVKRVIRNLVFDPPFTMDMVPDETKLLMGWL